jgi:hypothetical protein
MTLAPLSKKQRRELEAWARRAVHGVDESAIYLGILDDSPLDQGRIEFTLQLGHALLTDKPIILTVPHGVALPAKLAAVADRVVRFDPANKESMLPGLTAALTELGVNKQ